MDTIWRLVVRWVALTSGIGSFAFTVLMFYRAATGSPVPPNRALVMLGWLAIGMFVVSCGAAGYWERVKVRELEKKLRAAATKPDPELEIMRPRFQEAIAKLGPRHRLALRYVLDHTERDAPQLHVFLREKGEMVEVHEADRILGEMEQWGLVTMTRKGNMYGRYAVAERWRPLVIQWAAGGST